VVEEMESDHPFALYWLCRIMLAQERYDEVLQFYAVLARYHPDADETADITDRILEKCPHVIAEAEAMDI
jgi:hypothetical protein